MAPSFGLSSGNAVSGDGTVVVGYLADTPRSANWPFRWTASEGAVVLTSDSEPLDYGSAQSVSADGSVVAGRASFASRSGAFRWTEPTGVTIVGPGDEARLDANGGALAGDDPSHADGMHAYRWTTAAGAIDIGLLGDEANVEALSADGTTMVGAVYDAGQPSHAFVWDAVDGVFRLGAVDVDTYAYAVTADGAIVVGAHAVPGGGALPFRWDRARGMVDLDVSALAGSGVLNAVAVGIARHGATIIGTTGDNSWIWSEQTGARLLTDLLAERGVDLTGFSAFQIAGVSDDGTVLTGCVRDSALVTQAFIARVGD